jgi:hypothetical protein
VSRYNSGKHSGKIPGNMLEYGSCSDSGEALGNTLGYDSGKVLGATRVRSQAQSWIRVWVKTRVRRLGKTKHARQGDFLALGSNLSLSSLAGDPTKAKGIICKEVIGWSKTMPMTFFVADVKGRYNVLLG